MPVFEDRHRATSFGFEAERYDRTRPMYPSDLVDWLTPGAPGDAVDVGCGTGQLGRLLQERRWNVVGVEPDPRMADIAVAHGLPVEVATFEDWDAGTRQFDLVTCAQAWHWIDPAVGYGKAAALLRSGGRIALVWNGYDYDEQVDRAFTDVIEQQAPDLLVDSVLLGRTSPVHQRIDIEAFEHLADDFESPVTETFEHERFLTIDEWLDELPTHSQFTTLADGARQVLTDDLAVELHRVAPNGIRVRHPVHVTAAVRR